MRISGGTAGGVRLQSLRGEGTRPATDGMRQAAFSSLGSLVVDAVVLDLFAGTGAYGLEAVSRGARGAMFVEKSRPAAACIHSNCAAVAKSLATADRVATWEVRTSDVFQWLRAARGEWDLIFADPPYAIADEQLNQLLTLVAPLLKPNGNARLVLELPGDRPLVPPDQLELIRRLGKPRRNQPNCCFLAACRALPDRRQAASSACGS